MAFTEDLTQFFDTDDFAVAAIIKTSAGAPVRTINGNFTTPQQDVAIFEAGMQSNLPFVECATSDLAGVTKTHTMTINAVVYRIDEIAHDGTGVSIVQLRT